MPLFAIRYCTEFRKYCVFYFICINTAGSDSKINRHNRHVTCSVYRARNTKCQYLVGNERLR
jgi:hypothetical protein